MIYEITISAILLIMALGIITIVHSVSVDHGFKSAMLALLIYGGALSVFGYIIFK